MPHHILLTFGIILLASLAAEFIGRRTRLPRVTLLVLVGVAVGPQVLALLPDAVNEAAELVTSFSLTLVAFLLGSELSRDKLKRQGRAVMVVSFAVVATTWAVIAGGLALVGAPLVLAILLGAIGTATDPAATSDVVEEIAATGRFRDLVVGVVAIDDAWGLIIFGFAVAGAAALSGVGGHSAWWNLFVHLGGAVAVGVATGVPMALLSGRLKEGRPTQIEAIGFVLVCGGFAMWIGASYLLAATVAGAIVANLARHHEYCFREIEHFEWPFLTLFFVLSGAMLDTRMLAASAGLGVTYVVLRMIGRFIGGWIGCRALDLPGVQQHWMGLSLLPQAGVAVGMGLIAAAEFPEHGEIILAVTIGATVIFEIVGPILTRAGLLQAGGAASGKARIATTRPKA